MFEALLADPCPPNESMAAAGPPWMAFFRTLGAPEPVSKKASIAKQKLL